MHLIYFTVFADVLHTTVIITYTVGINNAYQAAIPVLLLSLIIAAFREAFVVLAFCGELAGCVGNLSLTVL